MTSSLQANLDDEKDVKERWLAFRNLLEKEQGLNTFYRYVFESRIEKVIVGGVDTDRNANPHKLTFIYKVGTVDLIDGNNFKSPIKKGIFE